MIKKKSLAQEVADIMREKIKGGEFPLDAQLPTEPALMELFQVGRSSVREAIKILVNSGFLLVHQGVGTFVVNIHGNEPLDSKFEKAQLSEILEVRQLLEIRIVEKAAENRTEKDLKIMRSKLAERKLYADAGDMDRCIHKDIEFHQAIAEASGNSILAELYRESSAYVLKSFLKQYKDTKPFVDSQDIHALLLRNIEKQDVKATRKTLKKIIGII